MRDSVFDSSAVLAYLFEEPCAPAVTELLENAFQAGKPILLSGPNWAEVTYAAVKKWGERQWQGVRGDVLRLPILVIPADLEVSEAAAAIKSTYRMSLGDSFAAGLARMRNAVLHTVDKDFKQVESIITINWLSH
ncbi:MAG: type II toxin-antitoxin system VapC family toxin [Nitrospirae bacterium]|nr:type II toxin-antitoxin system VapC family toxin [Nitrospirota bacterium]